jgi:hypothetical protein
MISASHCRREWREKAGAGTVAPRMALCFGNDTDGLCAALTDWPRWRDRQVSSGLLCSGAWRTQVTKASAVALRRLPRGITAL